MNRFEEISQEDKDLVLRLGFACYDRASGLLNHDLQDQYETKIDTLEESHKQEIIRMRNERDIIVQERVNTALNAVRNERTLAIDTMCDTIRKNREHETSEIRKSMGMIMEQMRSLVQEHKQVNEGSTKEIRDVIDVLRGSSTNSAIRGRIGESTTEAMLDSVLPGCTWENTSGTGGKADFQAIVPGIGRVLLDIKNHEKDHGGVPLRDRKKLMRDLDADTSAIGAILVATQSNIQSGSHCQVILTDERKPVVCCLLHGKWERLRDAIETLRACTMFNQSQDRESNEIGSEEAVRSLKAIMSVLCEQESAILKSRENVVRAMTEVNLALSRIDPHWNPSLREWLMVHLKRVETLVPKKDRMTLKNLREIPGIPKEAKGKAGRDKLRDELITMGVSINSDGSLPNSQFMINRDS
jgi:SpoU rRNA methylase family enzyme